MRATLVRRIKNWFEDALLQKLLKDSSQLLVGNVLEAGLSFVAVVLAARGLGPESYGILVLVQTYIIVVDEVINFQSWQALIKYGADALETESTSTFKRLIKFGTSLDGGTALLGTLVSIGGVYALQSWMQWSQELTSMLLIYSTFILSNLTGTPIAILRLFDRFDVLALQKVFSGSIKLAAVAVAFFADATLWGYLFAWLSAEMARHLLLLGLGWRELRRRGYSEILAASLRGLGNTLPGLWGYVWSTNLNGTVKMSVRRFDTVMIGGVLGPTAVGLYEVVKKFAKGLRQFTRPLYQTIYPELAKLWSRDNRDGFVRLMMRSAVLAGSGAFLFWIAIMLFGTNILEVFVGKEYVGAHPVMVWYILGVVVAVGGVPLTPSMLAMGRPRTHFMIHIASAILFFIILASLLYSYSLVGAGIAYLIYYFVLDFAMASAIYILLKNAKKKAVLG